MRERDVDNLIEQQEAEAKQRIWAKLSAQLNLESTPKQQPVAKKKTFKWAMLAAALVCIVTLSIVLPLTLRDSGSRYCDITQYENEELGQTLKEYSTEHNSKFLYVDWYGVSEDTNTNYAYIKGNKNDVVFFEESFINRETGEMLTFSVTDNKTKVDRFKVYYENCQEVTVKSVSVKFKTLDRKNVYATFEYKGYIYYLQLTSDEGQERLTEIIEDMLK